MSSDQTCERPLTWPLPIIFVLGPTGAGKSACAVRIAQDAQQRYGVRAHIVNCDVMQMYPGLPVATNKPQSDADTGGIPHHLIGHLPHDAAPTYTVHTFVSEATALIAKLRAADPTCLILVCGGTAYYAQGLLFEGEFVGGGDDATAQADAAPAVASPADDSHHSPVDTSALAPAGAAEESQGPSLWEQLRSIDPVMAQRWHPNDTRRIARSLEIYRETGQLPSVAVADLSAPTVRTIPATSDDSGAGGAPLASHRRHLVLWVDYGDREALFEKINRRVTTMAERGIVQEVAAYFAAHSPPSPADPAQDGGVDGKTARPDDGGDLRGIGSAIGCKEFADAVRAVVIERCSDDTPDPSVDIPTDHPRIVAALDALRSNTRRYARQQQRWLGNRFGKRYGSLLAPLFFKVEGTVAQTAGPALCRHLFAASVRRSASYGDDSSDPSPAVSLFDCSPSDLIDPLLHAQCAALMDALPAGVECAFVPPSVCDEGEAAPQVVGGDTRLALRTHHCDICSRTLCGDAQWEAHLRSRSHRTAKGRKERRAQGIPPSKRETPKSPPR